MRHQPPVAIKPKLVLRQAQRGAVSEPGSMARASGCTLYLDKGAALPATTPASLTRCPPSA